MKTSKINHQAINELMWKRGFSLVGKGVISGYDPAEPSAYDYLDTGTPIMCSVHHEYMTGVIVLELYFFIDEEPINNVPVSTKVTSNMWSVDIDNNTFSSIYNSLYSVYQKVNQ
jgi:hypothetical protein